METCLKFDAVLMLTWSDWYTEPRSNRYHYAVRFAATLPVFFLQHGYEKTRRIRVEKSGEANIDIIQVSVDLDDQQLSEVIALLCARGEGAASLRAGPARGDWAFMQSWGEGGGS